MMEWNGNLNWNWNGTQVVYWNIALSRAINGTDIGR